MMHALSPSPRLPDQRLLLARAREVHWQQSAPQALSLLWRWAPTLTAAVCLARRVQPWLGLPTDGLWLWATFDDQGEGVAPMDAPLAA